MDTITRGQCIGAVIGFGIGTALGLLLALILMTSIGLFSLFAFVFCPVGLVIGIGIMTCLDCRDN